MRYAFGLLFLLISIAAAYLLARDYIRDHPQDVPWTELDLSDPIGAFTGRKLAKLSDDPAQCLALLRDVGIEDRRAPPLWAGENCGYENGLRLDAPGHRGAKKLVSTR